MPIRLGQPPSGQVDMTNVRRREAGGGRTVYYRDGFESIVHGSPEEWYESLQQERERERE